MKKTTLLLLSALTVIAFSFTGSSEFEGKITYEITMEGANLPPEAKGMFAGSELSVYMKGTKSRTDVSIAMQNNSTISDLKTGTSVILMEIMGNKYKIKSDPSKEEKNTDVSVKYLDETKTVAGYKCKKAEITFKDETGNKQTSTIWYTEDILNHMGASTSNNQYKDIKGMPLEYEMNADRGTKMKMTAKTVSKETVPDSKFEIPADYKETTMEELQKEMIKMMQGGGQH